VCCSVLNKIRKIVYQKTVLIRDLSMSKEAYLCQKRSICIKRDVSISKETCLCQKRPGVCDKGPIHVKRDLSMSKEIYSCQKRPIHIKGDVSISKETCLCKKRPNWIFLIFGGQPTAVLMKKITIITKATFGKSQTCCSTISSGGQQSAIFLKCQHPDVLQCVAVCCSVLQCTVVCCSVLQCFAVCCSVCEL